MTWEPPTGSFQTHGAELSSGGPRAHGPECAVGPAAVHIVKTWVEHGTEIAVGDKIKGTCVGCGQPIEHGIKSDRRCSCRACKSAPVPSLGLYDTEVIPFTPRPSRQGEKLHGWGRK